MEDQQPIRNNRQVAFWLLAGAGMIMIQVLLGGITRLTESGLSITEWKPITGMLPPLNETQWIVEFDKYRGTDQFRYVHEYFSLHDFKFIFFWEWFHRVWARLMGVVFLVGFIYFLIKKKFTGKMIIPMVILFILGALQGGIGWIMVQSGLVPEKYFVGHVELATHFIAAMGLLCYTLWFALGLLPVAKKITVHAGLNRFLWVILIILTVQLTYGAFMAGLKAAPTAPTWPDINGYFVPPGISEMDPFLKNLFLNKLMIQFIHRGLAYLLLILILIWWIKAAILRSIPFTNRLRHCLLILVIIQALLGILTVLNAVYPVRLVWLGVIHQFTGMILLSVLVSLVFMIRKESTKTG